MKHVKFSFRKKVAWPNILLELIEFMKKRNHSSVAYLNASFTQKLMKEQKKHYKCIFCEDRFSEKSNFERTYKLKIISF